MIACLQILLAVLNVLLVVGSISLISFGAWIAYYSDNYFYQMLIENEIYTSMPKIMLVIGIIILIISTLGLYSSKKQKRVLFIIYLIAMIILLASLVAGCLLSFIFKETVDRSLRLYMLNTVRNYDPYDPNNPTTMGWNFIQTKFECCGIQPFDMGKDKHWMEWAENRHVNPNGEHRVPETCCKMNHWTQERFDCNTKDFAVSEFINDADCYDVLYSKIMEKSGMIIMILASVTIFLILCMIPAISLYCLIQ